MRNYNLEKSHTVKFQAYAAECTVNWALSRWCEAQGAPGGRPGALGLFRDDAVHICAADLLLSPSGGLVPVGRGAEGFPFTHPRALCWLATCVAAVLCVYIITLKASVYLCVFLKKSLISYSDFNCTMTSSLKPQSPAYGSG